MALSSEIVYDDYLLLRQLPGHYYSDGIERIVQKYTIKFRRPDIPIRFTGDQHHHHSTVLLYSYDHQEELEHLPLDDPLDWSDITSIDWPDDYSEPDITIPEVLQQPRPHPKPPEEPPPSLPYSKPADPPQDPPAPPTAPTR